VQKGSGGAVRRRSAFPASAGGAAGASGVGLQNRVFAWAAAAMVAERHLAPAGFAAGKVLRVGAQTGHHLDDIPVQTDSDNYALFQVEAGPQPRRAADAAARPVPSGGPHRVVEQRPHNGQMPGCHDAGQVVRREQVRPGPHAVYQRLRPDIRFQADHVVCVQPLPRFG
jgi:hypothetical protein